MRKYRPQGDYEKDFMKIMDRLSTSRQHWQVWEDLITVMACIINLAVDRVNHMWKERSKQYLDALERLGGPELAGQAFDIVIDALEQNPDQDFLGAMYMQMNLGNHWKGQFFTPYCVSKMMAQITLTELPAYIEKNGYASIADPCIGGGAMLIAAANSAKEMHINFQQHMLFTGQDIDRIVGMMAYIQLSLLGCPGYIVVADSITNPMVGNPLIPNEQEGQEFWYTPMYFHETWNFRRMMRIIRGTERNSKLEPINLRGGFMFEFEHGGVCDDV